MDRQIIAAGIADRCQQVTSIEDRLVSACERAAGHEMQPVAAPGHPLASLGRAATRDDLEPHVQLVLSDPVDPGGAAYGLSSARLWRFVDLGRRLDFLLAGFGWCRMPDHLVAAVLADARLVALEIEDDPPPAEGLTIYAAHRRDRALGPAGRWLLDRLRQRLAIG